MWGLKIRMFLLTAVLFAIMYAIISVIAYNMGITNFSFYLIFSIVMMLVQYMLGPTIVGWSMRVKYVTEKEYPELFSMMRSLTVQARLPMPKIGISQAGVPNAFAFGRSIKDARVCVTEGILRLLNKDELRAVLGHELSHIKNRDMLTITLLSVIPMILYRIAWHFMFYGNRRDSRESSSNGMLVGVAAFLFYFITNLLVLYASRVREYFADKGSVDLGNKPAWLASALYKLVYGSALASKEDIRDVEGVKAFFANDPTKAIKDLRNLRDLDLDRSGTIDTSELLSLQNKNISLSLGDKMLELVSTHPNMLKRIKRLSQWPQG